ncbi:MAG TPA: hypothetical protein VKB93_21325 [Thermoanaerobaculia bacterium]|nr:hypothetical protein [Thermoanaerobaculia bacterium]
MSLLRGEAGKREKLSSREYPITVHPFQTTAQMVHAGNYAYTNLNSGEISDSMSMLSEFFPVSSHDAASVVIKLIPIASSGLPQILREIQARDMRPATAAELLAFGSKYPEVQRFLTVVALGSRYRFGPATQNEYFLCLEGMLPMYGDYRGLVVDYWNGRTFGDGFQEKDNVRLAVVAAH